MDYFAIAGAIAARYVPGLVTPPAGLTNIAAATATPPNALAQSPMVVVWANRGDWVVGASEIRDVPAEFLLNFYYAKHVADMPRETAALHKWLGVLRDGLNGQMKLGLGASGVLKAIVTSWQIGVLTYAGIEYDGITIVLHVWAQETVTLTP